jgi:dCMP deaminase
MEKHKRKKFDELFMNVANEHSKMSHAVRAKVGAVVTKDERIVSCGWNGTPNGFDNNCETEVLETLPYLNGTSTKLVTKPEVVHAESNALLFAARNGTQLEGSTLYVTLSPCFECAKLIVQSGVKRVVFGQQYRDDSPITFLKQANIEVQKYERTISLGRSVSPTNDPGMYSPGEPEEGVLDPARQGRNTQPTTEWSSGIWKNDRS